MDRSSETALSPADFRQLAELRHQIREFLQFSEGAARSHGIEPQQHQLLLAIKGLPEHTRPTVRTLSARLCLRHHSTVELVDRLEKRGAVTRLHSQEDKREVLIELTALGEQLLQELSLLHWQELQTTGPALLTALERIVSKEAFANKIQHHAKN